jgi:hypothetical protein
MWKIALALFLLPFAVALFVRFSKRSRLCRTVNELELKIREKLQKLNVVANYLTNDYHERFDEIELKSFSFLSFSNKKIEEAIAGYESLLKDIDNTLLFFLNQKQQAIK